jgi:hypothetical protein
MSIATALATLRRLLLSLLESRRGSDIGITLLFDNRMEE